MNRSNWTSTGHRSAGSLPTTCTLQVLKQWNPIEDPRISVNWISLAVCRECRWWSGFGRMFGFQWKSFHWNHSNGIADLAEHCNRKVQSRKVVLTLSAIRRFNSLPKVGQRLWCYFIHFPHSSFLNEYSPNGVASTGEYLPEKFYQSVSGYHRDLEASSQALLNRLVRFWLKGILINELFLFLSHCFLSNRNYLVRLLTGKLISVAWHGFRPFVGRIHFGNGRRNDASIVAALQCASGLM